MEWLKKSKKYTFDLFQPKKFIAALQRISDQTYNSIFTTVQMQQIARVGLCYTAIALMVIFLSSGIIFTHDRQDQRI